MWKGSSFTPLKRLKFWGKMAGSNSSSFPPLLLPLFLHFLLLSFPLSQVLHFSLFLLIGCLSLYLCYLYLASSLLSLTYLRWGRTKHTLQLLGTSCIWVLVGRITKAPPLCGYCCTIFQALALHHPQFLYSMLMSRLMLRKTMACPNPHWGK